MNHALLCAILFISSKVCSLWTDSNLALLCNYQRDAATAPTVGDRVPYVIIKAAKGAKVVF